MDEQARFDKFDYRQKFEYWGLVLGSVLVVSTGLVLLYPVEVTQVLPGSVVPVAMVAHSNEGLLAFLTIITWHIYNAHLAPEVFPFNKTIFTGRISEERLRHEHPGVLEAVQRWADDELRSLNGQIEFVLRRALSDHGRTPAPKRDPESSGPETPRDG